MIATSIKTNDTIFINDQPAIVKATGQAYDQVHIANPIDVNAIKASGLDHVAYAKMLMVKIASYIKATKKPLADFGITDFMNAYGLDTFNSLYSLIGNNYLELQVCHPGGQPFWICTWTDHDGDLQAVLFDIDMACGGIINSGWLNDGHGLAIATEASFN